MIPMGAVFLAANGVFVAVVLLVLGVLARRNQVSHSARRRWTPDTAIRAVGRRGALRRADAAEYLGRNQHREAVPALCALLTDRDRTVRMVAARSLGRIGSPDAVSALLGSVTNARMPQQVVAEAMIRLGRPARTRLVAALGAEQPRARAVAVEVLGLVGAIDAIPRLVVVLRHDPVLEVKIRAARALGRIGTLSAFGALLDAARPDQPQPLRAVAAQALGNLGDPAATLRLTLLLSDDDYWVAHNAAGALVRLGEAGMRTLQTTAQRGTGQAAVHALEALTVHALHAQTASTAV